jgi:hypothetical protein
VTIHEAIAVAEPFRDAHPDHDQWEAIIKAEPWHGLVAATMRVTDDISEQIWLKTLSVTAHPA